MAIGKIIVIDNKTKRVVGKLSGSLFMRGDYASLMINEIEHSSRPPLTELNGINLENYLPCLSKGPFGGEVVDMYGLEVSDVMKGPNNELYGSVDLGYFSLALLFFSNITNPRHCPSGGIELPLWQVNELSGHRVPLIGNSGESLLERVCFGKAKWEVKKMWGEYIYFGDRGSIIEKNAATEVTKITREQFRELARPIEEQLREQYKKFC